MEYEFVKTCFNEQPYFSSTVNLWKHIPTNTYYISRDFREIIKPAIDYSNMLLYEPPPVKHSPYRSFLTNHKQVSNKDFISGFVVDYNSRWIL